jgi:hypothetical protein
VGTKKHNGDAQTLEQLRRRLCSMVRGIVQQNDGVVAPVSSLLVELLHELSEEHCHHACVRVGLSEGAVDVAERVDTNDHADTWEHLESRH